MARAPNNTSDVPRGVRFRRRQQNEPEILVDEEVGELAPRFWDMRSSRVAVFQTPDELWSAATEYFEWATDNPLYEAKAFAYEGVVQVKSIPKLRAFTLQGLCIFLGISRQTFENMLKGHPGTAGGIPGMPEMALLISEVIREQKFTGAAADLLNSQIITRDLGLAEKVDNKVTLEDERTPEQIAAGIESKLAGIATRYREDPLL